MADTEIKQFRRPAGQADMGPAGRDALQAEILFWEDMIETRGHCLPPEAVERMQHAMALAERRLLRCLEVTDPLNSRIYSLDKARRMSHE